MKRGIIALFFLALVSLIGIVGAANTCTAPEQIILKLSDDSNAHGGIFSAANHLTEICYDEIFTGSTGDGNRDCSAGAGVVLRLAKDNNAHAEGPAGTTLGYKNVCYGDLTCSLTTGSSCSGGESLVVKLSKNKNAHLAIGTDTTYTNIVCCKQAGAPSNPACSDSIDNDGDDKIDAADPGCLDTEGNYDLNDNDETDGAVPPATGEAYWTKEDDTLYASEATVQVLTKVRLVAKGIPAGITTINFNVYDRDSEPVDSDDLIKTISGIIVNNEAGDMVARTGDWEITPGEYNLGKDTFEIDPLDLYFIASGSEAGETYSQTSYTLYVTSVITPPVGKQFCSDYTVDTECNADALELRKNKNDPAYQLLKCDIFGDCECAWKFDKCELIADRMGDGDEIPSSCNWKCYYPDYTTGDCIDGVMNIESDSVLELPTPLGSCGIGSPPAPITKEQVGCTDQETEISCGAPELQLPFFGITQFIIGILGIAGIYALIIWKRERERGE